MVRVFTGENNFLLKAELNRLIEEFVSKHTEMGLERIDCEEADYDQIREALESLPFLAPRKMVVLDRPLANKEFVEKAQDLLENISESIDVLLVEPKFDKRLGFYKYLKKSSEFMEFKPLEGAALARWLVDYANAEGGSLSTTDANYLIKRVGGNQQLLANETIKLINYDPRVTEQTINLLTDSTPQSTIFELLDAALAGNSSKALRLYHEQRFLKVEPQQILALLAWQLHILAIVKTAGSRSSGEIASQAKINPYVVSKSQVLARSLSLDRLKRLAKQALTLDIKLKSQAIDADQALIHLLLGAGK